MLDTSIDGTKAQRVVAEKAYCNRNNRDLLLGYHRNEIMRKAARNRTLHPSENRFNKLLSKQRFRVEQCFGTMKWLFGLNPARYFSFTKMKAQLAMVIIVQNLRKATKKIKLTQKIERSHSPNKQNFYTR